ncbi:hypothetical protein VHEMI08554 [[Torrubiella] hemipterigena]|uniref:Uncharacterized protein n=1 Tax=[Torrubiella] hemipterigena TaxID=1531966 RepID=A0A0A1TPW7_9HYPO|nr:hypothetical protein VHEMI08554 [[Torrubiella] hemipterigena]
MDSYEQSDAAIDAWSLSGGHFDNSVSGELVPEEYCNSRRATCLAQDDLDNGAAVFDESPDARAMEDTPYEFHSHDYFSRRQQDMDDLEPGIPEWLPSQHRLGRSSFAAPFFASSIEKKAQNPAACGAVAYDIRIKYVMPRFLCRLIGFMLYCCLLANFYQHLGLPCNDRRVARGQKEHAIDTKSILLMWSETMVTMAVCFLIGQGFYGLRHLRERMERVRQTAITVAYAFLKTTIRRRRCLDDELELKIFECLALLTAYPVALYHQIQGNTCEPAVTNYCREISRALKSLRDGKWEIGCSPPGMLAHERSVTVEYFFERFSLNLDAEYRRQAVQTKTPSMAPQYIIYKLRNHFEDFVDAGSIARHSGPIIRENIDLFAMAGRDCGIYSLRDVVPITLLSVVDFCGRVVAFGVPVQNCEWIISETDAQVHNSVAPRAEIFVAWVVLSIISAAVLSILDEMWRLWDPLGKSTNVYAWSLGIASEIDHMLNEFYEQDTSTLDRRHAYMGSSIPLSPPLVVSCGECCERRTI